MNGQAAADPAEPGFRTFAAEGNITADAANSGAGVSSEYTKVRAIVPHDAQGLVAEMRWTGDATSFDLVLQSPRFCPAQEPTPTGLVESSSCAANFYATGESPGAFRADSAPTQVGPGSLFLVLDGAAIASEPCQVGECEWFATPWWRVAADAHYELRITVFYEDPVPDGFSAFSD